MGFVNRVVPALELEQQTSKLAEEIAAMPAAPVAITKEHVNAVSRAIPSNTSYADGDVLLSAVASPRQRKGAQCLHRAASGTQRQRLRKRFDDHEQF